MKLKKTKKENRKQKNLFEAFSSLSTARLAESFLMDLCTPAELEAMADRWAVVPLLEQGLSYRSIHAKTGVSLTTIGRVARHMQFGHEGYARVLKKVQPDAS